MNGQDAGIPGWREGMAYRHKFIYMYWAGGDVTMARTFFSIVQAGRGHLMHTAKPRQYFHLTKGIMAHDPCRVTKALSMLIAFHNPNTSKNTDLCKSEVTAGK